MGRLINLLVSTFWFLVYMFTILVVIITAFGIIFLPPVMVTGLIWLIGKFALDIQLGFVYNCGIYFVMWVLWNYWLAERRKNQI